ncbi:RNA-binding S4 domain-containing protein [Roseovarius autotrophicus]|uniref:RNA-binding S4 domain-containing protein n=1 Tax=Roseovarius autotrophicus TaxID=2824121 RepID=UPI0019ED5EE8|nr:RNA-binding S4 domain-containing protein [Roseovarius autotrophicus]MBE0452830.1 RNA-binding S4 domain-containing protein [Roseovarius sp.]
MTENSPIRLRIDKWLWQARFFRTRTLAAGQVAAGHVRVNGARVAKPAQAVGPGDVLTFTQGTQVRVVRIVTLGVRRGPAAEAQALYDDVNQDPSAPETKESVPPAPRFEGKGRPTKRDRRKLFPRDPGALE